MPPDAPLSPNELRSNRFWILLLAGFSIALLVGSIVFAVVRMPAMLAVQIRGATTVEVEIQRGSETSTRTLRKKESRDAVASLIDASRFAFNLAGPPQSPAETIVIRVIAPNRSSEVRIWNGASLQAGFNFRASQPQNLAEELARMPDEK